MNAKVLRRLISCVCMLAVTIGPAGGFALRAAAAVPAGFHGSAFSGSTQVITVTASNMRTRYASFSCYQKNGSVWNRTISNVGALIGKNGMVYDAQRVQDTDTTPSGIYGIQFAFGWADNPGTNIVYRKADNQSYWDENSGSPNYNRWVEGCPGGEYEQLITQPLYKYALALDYNWNQTPRKGAGIFIHLMPGMYTGGCVGIPENTLVSVLRWLGPSANTKVLICPQNDLGRYYYSDNLPENQSWIDNPAPGSYNRGDLNVTGWAVASYGVQRIDVYMDGHGLGSAMNFTPRGDVQRIVNSNGDYADENNGYSYTIPASRISSGTHELEIAAIGKDGSVSWNRRTFQYAVKPHTNRSWIDNPASGSLNRGDLSISGWAAAGYGMQRVDVYMDGHGIGSATQFTPRGDVQRIVNSNGEYADENNGYSYTIPGSRIGSGTHELEIAAVGNDGSVSWNKRMFQYAEKPHTLLSWIDNPASGSLNRGDLSISGWAVAGYGMQRVDVYMDGHGIGSATQFTPRGDVQRIINSNGDYAVENNGYSYTIPASRIGNGTHELEIAAIGKDGSVYWMRRTYREG